MMKFCDDDEDDDHQADIVIMMTSFMMIKHAMFVTVHSCRRKLEKLVRKATAYTAAMNDNNQPITRLSNVRSRLNKSNRKKIVLNCPV